MLGARLRVIRRTQPEMDDSPGRADMAAEYADFEAPVLTFARSRRILAVSEALVRLWRWFMRLTRIGFPKRFPIIQFPNAPLVVAFIAGMIAGETHGLGHAYARSLSYLSLGVWAYLELVSGVNWFRRLLGLGYASSTIVHLALALHSLAA